MVRELVFHRCIYAAHELELRLCTCVVRELVRHRGVRVLVLRRRGVFVVRELVRHRCIYAAHELAQHRLGVLVEDVNQNHRGVRVLEVRRRGGLVVRVLVRRRYICAVRELDDLPRIDHGIHACLLVFRHPCVVVCRKDSTHHCCAWRRVLRRVAIQLYCEHLGRVVRVVLEIQPLPPWTLALHAF